MNFRPQLLALEQRWVPTADPTNPNPPPADPNDPQFAGIAMEIAGIINGDFNHGFRLAEQGAGSKEQGAEVQRTEIRAALLRLLVMGSWLLGREVR